MHAVPVLCGRSFTSSTAGPARILFPVLWYADCASAVIDSLQVEGDQQRGKALSIMDDVTKRMSKILTSVVKRKSTPPPSPEEPQDSKRLSESVKKFSWVAASLVAFLVGISAASCGETKPTESHEYKNLSAKYSDTQNELQRMRMELDSAKSDLKKASQKADMWDKEQEEKKAAEEKAAKEKAEQEKAEQERVEREKAEQEKAAQQAAQQAQQQAQQQIQQRSQMSAPAPDTYAYYQNCDAVRAAGRAPLYAGQPGYRSALDRDHDGIACE